MKQGPWRAWWSVLGLAMLLGNCAAPKPDGHISLKAGTPWREVAKAGGKPTVCFSYLTGGRKYDLATLPPKARSSPAETSSARSAAATGNPSG